MRLQQHERSSVRGGYRFGNAESEAGPSCGETADTGWGGDEHSRKGTAGVGGTYSEWSTRDVDLVHAHAFIATGTRPARNTLT